ncbi:MULTISPECIES: guanitoxin biosynthesis MATE family efflux transporter GntT [Aerosakkonema]|uniref:guanitoxin biosynthesis MATE family efflux transporter GntT n=1 Tax=Aerosakkonema TaxID=1246629 RepID=UPI0035BC6885
MKQMLSSQYDFLPRFFRLAIANVLSNIMVPLASLISVIFLGHLSEIHHLAGVALAANLLNLLYMVLIFLRMGTTGVTAQAVGRNDREGVLLVGLRNGLIAIILGVAIIFLRYPLGEIGFALLKAEADVKAAGIAYFYNQTWGAPAILLNFVLIGWFLGQEKNGLVLILSGVGNASKIALDYLFIVKFGWESAGAGISYATSQYLALLIGLTFFCTQVKWQEVKAVAGKIWDTAALKSTVTLNGNILVSNFVTLAAFVLFNYEAASLGTIIYAENALLLQIFALSFYFVEGLGFGTETLTGIFKGKGNAEKLVPLVAISVSISFLVGIIFAGVPTLFPDTVFGLLTNHTEVTQNIDVYVPWLLSVVGFTSIGFMLEGYFLGLAEGHTLRNVSLASIVVGFTPAAVAAWHYENNHILWLALSLFLATRMVSLGVQLPRTFKSNIGDGSVSLPMIEEESSKQLLEENLQIASEEKTLIN